MMDMDRQRFRNFLTTSRAYLACILGQRVIFFPKLTPSTFLPGSKSLLNPEHLTSLKSQTRLYEMRILSKRPEDQATVLALKHPSTLKTLKHFFFDSSRQLQFINKDRSFAVSAAAQNPMSVKEPIPLKHLKYLPFVRVLLHLV
jgi:hypothetical protein